MPMVPSAAPAALREEISTAISPPREAGQSANSGPEDNHRQNISVVIVRRPEHQGEAGGVQQADKPGHHAAVAREKAVGEHAGDDGPGDAGDSVDADNPGRLQGGISFILLEKEDPQELTA